MKKNALTPKKRKYTKRAKRSTKGREAVTVSGRMNNRKSSSTVIDLTERSGDIIIKL